VTSGVTAEPAAVVDGDLVLDDHAVDPTTEAAAVADTRPRPRPAPPGRRGGLASLPMRATAAREGTGDREVVALVVVAVVVAAVLAIVWRRDSSEWPDDVRTVAGLQVGDDSVNGVPLRPGTFRVAGELADDLAVPDGTVLLGDVLPTDRARPDPALPGSGWRAHLLVAGDPADAVADLDRQADARGLAPVAGRGCDDELTGGWEPGAVACGFAWRGAGGRELVADLVRGVRTGEGAGDAPASLLRLTLADRTVDPAPDPAAPAGPDPAVPDVALPGGWADPPEAGERLGDGALAALRLPEGADAVVAAWPSADGDATVGAVAELTGDVDAVLGDLAAQLEEATGERPTPEHATLPGGALVRLSASGAGTGGGGDGYVVTATTVGDRTWLTVETAPGG
jgi:hypothetical protein